MKQLIYIFTLILTLASCSQRQEATLVCADSTAVDTTVLRVAVLPAMNCLPLFYAKASGLSDSLGLRIELLRYQAQMDVDTAVMRHHVDIAFTDLIRAERISRTQKFTPFAGCDEALSLISQKEKRVKRINQMKEQMIAIARLSATDYWCDRILDSTKVSHDDIYRPQINNVRLRAEMIRTGLIDAALMGEPYATWMVLLGNKCLTRTQTSQTRLFAWAATDSISTARRTAFRNLLDSATAIIGRGDDAGLLRDILHQEYGLPQALADTIALPAITQTSNVRAADIETAKAWLETRQQ